MATRFGHPPGTLDPVGLPASAEDARRLRGWAAAECLPWFGPYEDAMAKAATGLFHTRLSPVVNLHRILPAEVLADALAAPVPLASQEGFVRQVLGWREFVRHVHRETNGFRDLPGGEVPRDRTAGDGGYETWSGRAWGPPLGAQEPVPPAYLGRPSGMACLDEVVAQVWRKG